MQSNALEKSNIIKIVTFRFSIASFVSSMTLSRRLSVLTLLVAELLGPKKFVSVDISR